MSLTTELEQKIELLRDELAEVRSQQAATSDILKIINRSAFDLQAVLTTLIQTGISLCQAARGVIWLRNGEKLSLAAHVGYADEWVASALRNPIAIAEDAPTTSGRVAFTGEILHVENIPADPRFGHYAGHAGGNYRAGLTVPLKRDGQVLGVIAFSRPEARLFLQREVDLVQTFADQAVIALENTRLFNELQARTTELSESLQQQTATADVLKVISRSAFDLQAVLDTLVESVARLCEADHAWLFRREGDKYQLATSFGFSTDAYLRIREILMRTPVTPGRGSVSARAVLELKPVQILDPETDPDYQMQEVLSVGRYRTALGVPLLREGGEPIGIISVTRWDVRAFSTRQIDLVTTFADQAVIAIENVRLFEEVQSRTRELSKSLEDLRTAQDRLVQTEKLASLGQLTAGIAHEIKNPLNFVSNFAALSTDLVEELNEILDRTQFDEPTRQSISELTTLLKGNLDKIVQHGRRADSIVKNMLLHSRSSSKEQRSFDVNSVVEEALSLAFHGAKAAKPNFSATLERQFDSAAGTIDGFPQEIARVLLNLISNSFYATSKKLAAHGQGYEPTVVAATRDLEDRVEIRIRDNGTGIPDEIKEKMFDPFFTTKPAGDGTGLGLSLSHDIIVKQHLGTIDVETELDSFTEIRIVLPRTARLPQPSSG